MVKRIIGTSGFKNGFLKEDRFFIALILLFGMGILAGSVAVSESQTYVNEIWQGYIIRRMSQSFFSVFIQGFFSLMVVIAINYILGHCAIGAPFLSVVILICGIGRGIMFCSFMLNYGFLGFIKSILLFGVQNALMSLILIFAAKTSAEHSKQIFDFGYKRKENDLNLRRYNRKYLLYIIIAFILCFFDAVMASKTSFIIG